MHLKMRVHLNSGAHFSFFKKIPTIRLNLNSLLLKFY